LIRLASDSRYRAYPQTSLLTCRLGFGQVGLAAVAATHPLAGNNQFLSRLGLPRLWIYLGTTGRTFRNLNCYYLLKVTILRIFPKNGKLWYCFSNILVVFSKIGEKVNFVFF
jgi:hypothetical protein